MLPRLDHRFALAAFLCAMSDYGYSCRVRQAVMRCSPLSRLHRVRSTAHDEKSGRAQLLAGSGVPPAEQHPARRVRGPRARRDGRPVARAAARPRAAITRPEQRRVLGFGRDANSSSCTEARRGRASSLPGQHKKRGQYFRLLRRGVEMGGISTTPAWSLSTHSSSPGENAAEARVSRRSPRASLKYRVRENGWCCR